jgi:hypothetical protein
MSSTKHISTLKNAYYPHIRVEFDHVQPQSETTILVTYKLDTLIEAKIFAHQYVRGLNITNGFIEAVFLTDTYDVIDVISFKKSANG